MQSSGSTPRKPPVTELSRLWEQRKRHWQTQGLRGRDVLEAMAGDPELPPDITQLDVAAILGVQVEAIKARRRKRMPPAFFRTGTRSVRYDIASLADFMARGVREDAIEKGTVVDCSSVSSRF